MIIMTTGQLADRLSQFVWEHVTDFMEGGTVTPESQRGRSEIEGYPVDVDEILIFFLWLHTRVVQQAFAGRYEGPVVKEVLDAMHRRVFTDLEDHGIPASRLPIFEQVMSARYAEYYAGAKGEEQMVGRLAASNIDSSGDGPSEPREALAGALARSVVDIGGPLSDFLSEVQPAPEPAGSAA